MVRLWTHEVLRVFYDRLVNEEDRLWSGETIVDLVDKHFKERLTRVLEIESVEPEPLLLGMRKLIFGDFMIAGADPKIYTQIADQNHMLSVVQDYLSDHNATSKKPMNLVMFQFALEHVARICRIITSPGGNALLVGLGGSGRQSLTRLAAFIQEFEVRSKQQARLISWLVG